LIRNLRTPDNENIFGCELKNIFSLVCFQCCPEGFHTAFGETCQTLQPVVESGTYTPLANELKKLSQKFFTKLENTSSQVDNLLIALAKKYDAFTRYDERNQAGRN